MNALFPVLLLLLKHKQEFRHPIFDLLLERIRKIYFSTFLVNWKELLFSGCHGCVGFALPANIYF